MVRSLRLDAAGLGIGTAALVTALLASAAWVAAELSPPKAIDDLRLLPEARLAGWLEQADTPDYRGYSISEGGEYASGFLATHCYTENALGAVSLVEELADADERNVFLWGHSLGGEVTLRALLGPTYSRMNVARSARVVKALGARTRALAR